MLKHSTYFNIKWLIIAVIFTATVIFLTHLPQDAMPFRLQVSGLDKIEHFVAYGAITIPFVLSLKNRFSLLSAAALFFAISAVGTIDELTQPFVNRTASLADCLADIVGVLFTFGFFCLLQKIKTSSVGNVDI